MGEVPLYRDIRTLTPGTRTISAQAEHELLEDSQLRCGGGTARAEDVQGKPTQSHISPRILVHQEKWGCRPVRRTVWRGRRWLGLSCSSTVPRSAPAVDPKPTALERSRTFKNNYLAEM